MRHTITETHHQNKPLKLILFTICCGVGMLILANVFLTTRLSNLGIHLKNLQSQTETLELQNQQLETYLHKSGSLHTLEQEALNQGFSADVSYLNLQTGSVASIE